MTPRPARERRVRETVSREPDTREPVVAMVQCAMAEEAEPFLSALADPRELDFLPERYQGRARFVSGRLAGQEVLVVTSGIGATNATAALMAALQHFYPQAAVVAGTTGGLAPGIRAGDLVIGEQALYHQADATAFGYQPGQLPGMPAAYAADPALSGRACDLATAAGLRHRRGLVGSADSFVTGTTAPAVRTAFPQLLAVDMETAAIAQVCWSWRLPWVSVRAVSDLCDPAGAADFEKHSPDAARRSFRLAEKLIATIVATGRG